MGLPVGLNRITLRTLVALPFLLTVLPTEVFLDARKVSQRPGRIMMHAARLRADINPLPDLFARPLSQLPGQVMASPVELQILVPLESFVADFAHETVGRH